MNLDQLLRDTLERTASTQTAPDRLAVRSIAAGRHLRRRNRAAGAVASAGVVAVAAVGGVALHSSGHQSTATLRAGGETTLPELLAQMATTPDPAAGAQFWLQRESLSTLQPAGPAEQVQQWLGRTADGRQDGDDGTTVAIPGPADYGTEGPLSWDQLSALPTDPTALSAWVSRNLEQSPAEPGLVAGEATYDAELGLLQAATAPPALRAAVLGLIAQIPGVEVDLHAVDSQGRPGIGLLLPASAHPDRAILDASDGHLLDMQILSRNGSVLKLITYLVSAPAAGVGELPAGVGPMVEPTGTGTPVPAASAAPASAG